VVRGIGRRLAAEDGDNDNADNSCISKVVKACNVPYNNSDPETEIGRQRGFGGISAKDYKRLKACVAQRAECVVANNNNNNNNNNTDNSRISKVAKACNIPYYKSDSETEIGRQRVFISILAKNVKPQPEDEDDNNNAAAIQP